MRSRGILFDMPKKEVISSGSSSQRWHIQQGNKKKADFASSYMFLHNNEGRNQVSAG